MRARVEEEARLTARVHELTGELERERAERERLEGRVASLEAHLRDGGGGNGGGGGAGGDGAPSLAAMQQAMQLRVEQLAAARLLVVVRTPNPYMPRSL